MLLRLLPDLQGLQGHLDRLGLQDRKETEELQVPRDRTDSPGFKDLLVSTANPVLAVLQVNAAPMDSRARTAHQASQELKAKQDFLAVQGLPVWPVPPVAMVSLALKGLRARKANPVLQV